MADHKEITYRLAVKEDYPEVIAFYKEHFGNNRTEAYYKWAYDDNPMGKGALFIAVKGSQIIGTQGIIAYRFLKDGKWVLTYKSEDSLVSKESRGKGIFANLYKMVFDYSNEHLVWGFTQLDGVFSKVGMHSNFQCAAANWVSKDWVLKEKQLLKKENISKAISWGRNIFNNPSSTSEQINIQFYKCYEIDLSDFVLTQSKQNPDVLYPDPSPETLRWRLNENEAVVDHNIAVSKGKDGQIEDVFLLAQYEEKYRLLCWYFSDKSDEESRILSLQSLLFELSDRGISSIETWFFDLNSKNRIVYHWLKSRGFTTLKKGLFIVNNGPKSNIKVDDIYFSIQLAL